LVAGAKFPVSWNVYLEDILQHHLSLVLLTVIQPRIAHSIFEQKSHSSKFPTAWKRLFLVEL